MAEDISARVGAAAAKQKADLQTIFPNTKFPEMQAEQAPSWYAQATGNAPTEKITYGNRLTEYPSGDDVAFAKKADVGYGSGNESFLSGQSANVWSYPGKKGAQAVGIQDVRDATEAATDPKLRNIMGGSPETAALYTAAHLAALRSPVTALGFDPHKVALDLRSGDKVSAAGMYRGGRDSIYSNAAYPSNIVHESTHRGLKRLRESGIVPKEVLDALPPEESVVRYIMSLHMGDPEKNVKGEEGRSERREGLRAFGRDSNDPQKYSTEDSSETRKHRDALNKLNDYAAKYIFQLHPGGPR